MFDRHFFATRRAALGLSVEALAAEMLVAPSTVRRWESGETCPSLRMLVLASRHLCIPLLWLISDEDTEERRKAETVAELLREDTPETA
ncbi:helix-turn-helix domain-containing protein [Streptomyces sp. NPDC001604]|uniref:helix-turn-helix domain-containing protein n=1 Tax=Streptomyces sp. NPDC001604 TaxID=3364593 RepID=UPI0036A30507